MSDPILELLAAPPNPSMRVDENAVYAGGRRRVRRRVARRGVLGLVGVMGAAAIAFATLGTGADRDALPAGPSPSGGAAGRVSAEVLDGRYAVEVVPRAPSGQPNVIFYAVQGGVRQQLAGSDATPDVVSMGTGSGAEGVMLGTAPADAAAFLTVTDSAKGGVTIDQQLLPGTDFQAVALDFENPGDVESYRDTIWRNQDYEVRNARGQLLPSTMLAERDMFFVARDPGVIGLFNPEGGWTKHLSSGQSTTMGSGKKDEAGGWSWRSVTLLPPGSREVAFTWTGDEQPSQIFVEALPNGEGNVAFAYATAPASSSGPKVTSVSWSDEGGTRHTEAVE